MKLLHNVIKICSFEFQLNVPFRIEPELRVVRARGEEITTDALTGSHGDTSS